MNNFTAVVYDPSEKVSQNRWIWKNCAIDVSWENLRELISANENMPGDIVTGIAACPDYSGLVCIFRRYRMGLDTFGRSGRYFIAMIRITGKDDVSDKEVATFFASIEKQLDFSARQEYVRLNPDAFCWEEAPAGDPESSVYGDSSIIQMHKAFDRMKDDWALWGTSQGHEPAGIRKLSQEDAESHCMKPFGKLFGKKIIREGGDPTGKQSSRLRPQIVKGCLGAIAIALILLIVIALLVLFIFIKKCGGSDISTLSETKKAVQGTLKKDHATTPDGKTTHGTEDSGKMRKFPDSDGDMNTNQTR